MSEPGPAVILFDGQCALCDASARWIARRDRREAFRFGALQSDAGRSLLRAHGLDPDVLDSVTLLDAGGARVRSDAAIEILARLGLPWSLARALRIVPRPLRDRVYTAIARRRHRLLGAKNACAAPSPELRRRLID